MADTIVFNTTDDTFTIIKNGNTLGTWDKISEGEIDINEWSFDVDDNQININLVDPYLGEVILPSHTVTVDSVDKSALGMRALWTFLKENVLFTEVSGAPTEVVVLSLNVTITDTQIKASPAPIQLLAAPGANKYYVVISAALVTDTTAGAYTNVQNATGRFYYTPYTAISNNIIFLNDSVFSDAGISMAQSRTDTNNAQDFDEVVNTPLWFVLTDDFSAPADGNAANTMKLNVVYTIVDLTA